MAGVGGGEFLKVHQEFPIVLGVGVQSHFPVDAAQAVVAFLGFVGAGVALGRVGLKKAFEYLDQAFALADLKGKHIFQAVLDGQLELQ